jgi:hypothetical protein
MLLVVVSNILCSVDPHSDLVNHWLSHRSIKPFPKLALCYALLAKLPAKVLRGVFVNRESLLITLFPVICGLFDGYVSYTPLLRHMRITMFGVGGVGLRSPAIASLDLVPLLCGVVWQGNLLSSSCSS